MEVVHFTLAEKVFFVLLIRIINSLISVNFIFNVMCHSTIRLVKIILKRLNWLRSCSDGLGFSDPLLSRKGFSNKKGILDEYTNPLSLRIGIFFKFFEREFETILNNSSGKR
ncbi:hypothetical protein BpHYR1_028476, partial [Brachionus plicatilis]